jgi:potassium-transporting ATPase ATP-binding subunit
MREIGLAFRKLDPRNLYLNPVLFVTFLGTLLTSYIFLHNWSKGQFSGFDLQVVIWLWLTLLLANFAEALAESRGKAQTRHLHDMKMTYNARLLVGDEERQVIASTLKKEDCIVCRTGDLIPVDGEVIEGIASVDESAITGESAPVIRESGGDRSAVTEGTRVLSDQIVVRVTAEPGTTFLDRMIALAEGELRKKSSNEIALTIFLSGLSLLFLLVVISLKFFADFSASEAGQNLQSQVSVPALVLFLICLLPTTISALLSAIAIAGMDRALSCHVVAKSGPAVEAAGDIDLLMLDKTGTLTLGNRVAVAFYPAPGVSESDFTQIAQLASLADETAEGRSIVILAKQKFDWRGEALDRQQTNFIPFYPETRLSGIDITDETGKVIRTIRKGAVDAIQAHIERLGGQFPDTVKAAIDSIAKQGGTPLLVSDNQQLVGVIYLKDAIKGGMRERFAELRKMGLKTLMVTGDNPLTAAAIAAEAGIDDFMAQATPEMKLERIRAEQKEGHRVAMAGDGTSDAPALAQADVGMAMNAGTQESREAGNMVDLDNNPTKLIEIVHIGKQLLMTRGVLTTFSLAKDVAMILTIVPALFGTLYPAQQGAEGPLVNLNFMNLHSAESALLSALIFNALLIPALLPLALRGVKITPQNSSAILCNHLIIFGVGGLILPFLGIKLMDLLLVTVGLIS